MRLLIAAEYFPNPFKGYLDHQAAQFVRFGARVSFLAFGHWGGQVQPTLAAAQPDLDVRYVPLSASRPRHLARGVAAALRRPRDAARVLGRAARRARRDRTGLGDVVRGLLLGRPEVDVCLVHDLGTLVQLRMLPWTLPDVPVALWYHGGETPGSPVLDPTEVAAAASRVDLVFANTRYAADHLAGRGFQGVPVEVQPLGFFTDDFPRSRERRFLPTGTLRLLFVGRLSREKGVDTALAALEILPPEVRRRVQLRIVGIGLHEQALRERVRRSGLESTVSFDGVVPHSELPEALAEADLLLLPSRPIETWEENQGMVLQEAMLTGLPVLTTRSGGIPEVVPEAIRSRLVPPDDPDALARAIRDHLTLPDDAWHRLSDACARFARERFEMERVTRPVYDRLVNLAGR